MQSKILVTGASGFVGSNLVKNLVAQGNKVSVLLRKDSYHPFLTNLKIKKFYGDIKNPDSIKKAMKCCQYVYHSAAFISYNKGDAKGMYEVNVIGTRNIMNTALKLKIKKVVHVSACAAIGYSKGLVDEKLKFLIRYKKIAYMYTKHLAEVEVIKAFRKGLNVTIVNPCTIFGQGDKKLNTGAVIKNIKEGKLLAAPPGGTAVVSVDDVVNGILLAMKYGKSGERYILSNENISYKELFNIIAKELKVKKINIQLPHFSYYLLLSVFCIIERLAIFLHKGCKITSEVISISFKYRYFSSQKARKELNWKPSVPIREAIGKAIDFYKKERLL